MESAKSRGWIYVLSNPAMPGLLKVGKSSKDPSGRARELANSGHPDRFELIFDVLVTDYHGLELAIHNELKASRYCGTGQGTEFFACGFLTAVDVIRRVCGEKILLENVSAALQSELAQRLELEAVRDELERLRAENELLRGSVRGRVDADEKIDTRQANPSRKVAVESRHLKEGESFCEEGKPAPSREGKIDLELPQRRNGSRDQGGRQKSEMTGAQTFSIRDTEPLYRKLREDWQMWQNEQRLIAAEVIPDKENREAVVEAIGVNVKAFCPSCRHLHEFAASLSGRIKCWKCNGSFYVPPW